MNHKDSLWKKTEFYVALGMIVFAAVLTWQILGIRHADSRMLPMLALVVTIAAAAGQMCSVIKNRENLRDVREILMKKRELVLFLMLFASCFLYGFWGFYVTVFLLLVGITMTVQAPLTWKKAAAGLVYDVLLIALVYICFAVMLGMVTPAGLFI